MENYMPYQKCPKCDGQGIVSKPPYIAGDVNQWTSTSISFTCDVCNGSKIIPMALITYGDDNPLKASQPYPLIFDCLPNRVINSLMRSNYEDMGLDEFFKERRMLRRIRGIGTKTLLDIDNVFKQYNLL